MLKIKLINMPFADIVVPSIALTQIKAVTDSLYNGKVNIDIHYLNHNVAQYLSEDMYNYISKSGNSNNSGFGDWFFRQEAFPYEADNINEYLKRYGQLMGFEFLKKNENVLRSKREGLGDFLENLVERYELWDADIVGFTSMFMQNIASLALARKIKERNNSVVTVMGGANCETPMGQELTKNFEVIDYIFSGTSLISFPLFVGKVLSGNKAEVESINGVFSRKNCHKVAKQNSKVLVSEDGEVKTTGPIGDEKPIDECIRLDYDSFIASFDQFFPNTNIRPYLLFETSRGCWWGARAHCTFCGLNSGGMAYRAMKNEKAVSMIEDLIERYGHRIKRFSSVDNILPQDYVKGVFPFIKKRDDITFFYEVKASLTSEELEILANAGVIEVQPGIEALATSTLKLMKKGTTAFQNIQFLTNCIRYSIIPHWNVLIGFPGEEESVYEKYYEVFPSFYHLPPPQGVFPVRFDRYSPYFTEADKYNLKLRPLDYYFFTYPLKEESLFDIAYYFGDRNFDAEYTRLAAKWLGKLSQRLKEWRQQWEGKTEDEYPRLYFSGDIENPVIIDGRQGNKNIIKITPLEKQILELLDNRRNVDWLTSQVPDASAGELEHMVVKLEKQRLLFEENGSYMSLVSLSAPSFRKFRPYF